MTITVKAPAERLVKCSVCGALTEWDESILEPPECVACWDGHSMVENRVAAYQRAYYEKNRDRVAASQRAQLKEVNRC